MSVLDMKEESTVHVLLISRHMDEALGVSWLNAWVSTFVRVTEAHTYFSGTL